MDKSVFPKDCDYEDGLLTKRLSDGTEIFTCNYVPAVVSATQVDPNAPGDPLVLFRLIINGKQRDRVYELRLSAFRTQDLERLDVDCRSEGESRTLPRLMYELARRQITSAMVGNRPYFTQSGWATLEGAPVYVAGNAVISAAGWVDPSSYSVAPSLRGLTLETDEHITETAAAQHVRKLCRLRPGVSDMLVAGAVVGHIFSLFAAAEVTPRFAMYLIGPSMMKKTTLAKLIGVTYNRTSPDCPQLVNLLSTNAAVHSRVSALADCCNIVDDLNASESKAEMRRREERVSEIIRTAGNASGREHMEGKSTVPQLPRGVPIITAEYGLTAYSTMARCVTLHLDSPVDNNSLTVLQQRPKALSTFWYYFLRWACGLREGIAEVIQRYFAAHRAAPALHGMDRLADAYVILDVGMLILTEYMQETDSAHKSAINLMKLTFENSLDIVEQRQVKELKRLQQFADQARFSKMLADLYYNGRLDLRKKKCLGPGCDGAGSKTFLYLTTDRLAAEARRYFHDNTITPKAITAELRKNGLLEMDQSGRSTKKINGVRYLHIPIDRLMAYAGTTGQPFQGEEHDIFDRWHNQSHML